MKPSTFVVYIGVIAVLIFTEVLGYLVNTDERKCTHIRVEKKLKAKCFDMNLKEVPTFLSTSTEIMDLSYNRIKKLRKHSFKRYTSIRYLILFENKIQIIEPGTFSHLTALEEIDLSNNALITIPLELFSLPSLRNLYVDSNELSNLHRDLEKLEKPIKAPLEYLNVADCGLHDIPNLGILPRLWHLNASLNPLDELTVERFSPLCHLQSIDLKDSYMPPCSCQVLFGFFAKQGIKTSFKINCDIPNDGSCAYASNITIFNEDYDACQSVRISAKANLTWIGIAGAIVASLLLLIIILFFTHRRNRKKRKKAKRLKRNADDMQRKQERLMNPS